MITRAQIIADLMACLASIDPDHGFPLAVRELRRGIHLAEELAEMPALTLFNERVETLDQTSSTAARRLVLHLWGAVHVRHDDYSQLDQLAAACLKALADPNFNPHWQATSCGRLEVYEGGAGDPLGLFDLEFTVDYESPLDTL